MNFGQDGARSSFKYYKNENREEAREETFRRETVFFLRLTIIEVIDQLPA